METTSSPCWQIHLRSRGTSTLRISTAAAIGEPDSPVTWIHSVQSNGGGTTFGEKLYRKGTARQSCHMRCVMGKTAHPCAARAYQMS